MAAVNKVSNQPLATEVNAPDLLLISQSQNAPYNTIWTSKKIMFNDLAGSVEKKFRNENFKDELDVLDEIYSTYLNSGNLTIKLVKEGDVPKIQLLSSDIMFSELDASLFVKLSNAYTKTEVDELIEKIDIPTVNDSTVTITFGDDFSDSFTLNQNVGKTISIPKPAAGKTYSAGDGLSLDDTTSTFSVDSTIARVSQLPPKTKFRDWTLK